MKQTLSESKAEADARVSGLEEDRLYWEQKAKEVAAERDRLCAEARGAASIISQLEEIFPNWKGYRDLPDCATVTLDRLRTEVERLQSLLRQYGYHKDGCRTNRGGLCDCGLTEALNHD